MASMTRSQAASLSETKIVELSVRYLQVVVLAGNYSRVVDSSILYFPIVSHVIVGSFI